MPDESGPRPARSGRAPRRWALATAGILLGALAISQVYGAFVRTAVRSPQSRSMIERSGGLGQALRPGVWPPGYPLLLLAARRIRVPIDGVNLLLFGAALGLAFAAARQGLPGVSPVWLPLVYAACAFNYRNLSQLTAEALVVPASLLALLLLARYRERPSRLCLLALSLCAALLVVSRYQVALWLLPVVIAHLALATGAPRWTAARRAAGFAIVALAPVSWVMWRNDRETGFLTGMDRMHWASREPSAQSLFAGSTGLADNVRLTVKTYVLDFASPVRYATHGANRDRWEPSAVEIAMIGLFLAAVGSIALAAARAVKAHGGIAAALAAWHRSSPVTALATQFLLAYLALTIAAWSLGNNDPIYTRFLYPSYIYFMIALAAGYALVKSRSPGAPRAPFVLLCVLLVLVNVYKMSLTVPGAGWGE
jgi:hypothetical protein